MGGLIPPIFAELRATNTELNAKVDESKAKLAELDASGSGSLQKMAAVGGGALAALGVVAVATSAIGVKAAMDYEQAHTRLVTTVKNSGLVWSAEQDSVESLDHRMQNLAFTHSETEASLARLLPAAHNMANAERDVALAADIARYRHIDLASATQMLVGIEAGRMRGLVQLGISTKDATGATLTSAEAIQKVSDVVHGQGEAYMHTFAGEVKGLEVNAEELAVSLGEFLIPIISELGHDAAAVFGFFAEHRTLTIALASAVAGVLVPAMAVFIGMKVVDFAESVGAAWLKLINLIPGLTVGEAAKAAAQDADTVALEANTVATEANSVAAGESVAANTAATAGIEARTVALDEQMSMLDANGAALEMGSGQLALFGDASMAAAGGAETAEVATGGLAIGLGTLTAGFAVAVAAGYGLHVLLGGDLSAGMRQGRTDAENFAKGLEHDVQGAMSYHQALDIAKNRLAEMQQGASTIVATVKAQGGGFQEASEKAVYYRDGIKAARDEIDKLKASHQADIEQTKAVAQTYGISLPDAVAAGGKAMSDAIKHSEADFGDWATHALVNAGVTADTMSSIAQQSEAFSKSIESSVSGATDPFSKFKSATSVSESDMESFFVGSQQKAVVWSQEIQRLIGEGVDQGIVQQMAKAGPDSLPALDAFSQMVDAHGVAWVNSTAQAGLQAAQETEHSFSAQEISVAIHGAQMALLQNAITADMRDHTTTHLAELERSTDTNLSKAATDAARAMGEMQGSIDSVHGKDVYVNLVTSGFDQLGGIIAGINSIPTERDVSIVERLTHFSGAHGLVGLAHGGAPSPVLLAEGGATRVGQSQIVGPNQPVVIGEGLSREAVVPLDNFGDMVDTIRVSGAAGSFARAAALAGGAQDSPARSLVQSSAKQSTAVKREVHHHTHQHQTDINVAGSVWSVRDLTAAVLEELRRELRIAGNQGLTGVTGG